MRFGVKQKAFLFFLSSTCFGISSVSAGVLLDKLNGRWSIGHDCALEITVFGDRVQSSGPRGFYIERVQFEDSERVQTVMISNSLHNKNGFRQVYKISGDKLWIGEIDGHHEMIFTRC